MRHFKKFFSLGLIFSLTLVQFAQGQGYESIFGDSSTSWKFYREAGEAEGIDLQKISSDTTYINSKPYRKLKRDEVFVGESLREDTSSGKVWVYDSYKEKEFLVMDLSLQEKDSFFVPYTTRYDIDSGWHYVDTVFFKSTKKIILFNQKEGERFDSLKFMEGIGPNLGFHNGDRIHYMICAFKDGKNTYLDSNPPAPIPEDSNFSSCPKTGDWTTSLDDFKKQKFQVKTWPNPATEEMDFKVKGDLPSRSLQLTIYNASGRQILSKPVRAQRFQLQKPGKSHLYFYKLITHQGRLLDDGKLLFAE